MIFILRHIMKKEWIYVIVGIGLLWIVSQQYQAPRTA